MAICACYLWEIELNVGLDMLFDNMRDCGGMQEKSGEVIIMRVYAITNDEIVEFATGITLVNKSCCS